MAPAPASSPLPSPSSFWSLAFRGPVVRRALGYAVAVGAILIAINHADALLRGDVDGVRIFKMLLTLCVPYAVSTLSSVSAMRSFRAKTP